MDENKNYSKSIKILIDILKHVTTLEVGTFILFPIFLKSIQEGSFNKYLFSFGYISIFSSIAISILGMTLFAVLIAEMKDQDYVKKNEKHALIAFIASVIFFLIGLSVFVAAFLSVNDIFNF